MNMDVILKAAVSHLIFQTGELHNLVSIFGRILWFWVEAELFIFLSCASDHEFSHCPGGATPSRPAVTREADTDRSLFLFISQMHA